MQLIDKNSNGTIEKAEFYQLFKEEEESLGNKTEPGSVNRKFSFCAILTYLLAISTDKLIIKSQNNSSQAQKPLILETTGNTQTQNFF